MPLILEQKLAERLFILNDRQTGILTRVYYMKHELSDQNRRPDFLPGGDKSYEAGWKLLLKKFPSSTVKSTHSCLQPFSSNLKKRLSEVSVYYFILVDILELRDHFRNLLGSLSVAQIVLDITVNYDLTRLYLDLVTDHIALMLLLSRVRDVKGILILFNFLYTQLHGKHEPNFPRMAEYFGETAEGMLNILHTDVNPYYSVLSQALCSLSDVFVRRTVRAQNWSDCHFLDILHEPHKIAHTVLGDQLQCELIPYERMERWIVFCYLVIFPELSDEESFNLLKVALRYSVVVELIRNEVLYPHSLYQSFLESNWSSKIGSKRISEIKETFAIAHSQTPKIHADKRAYLRSSLHQMHLIFSDEPGLLGPKLFLPLMALSYASDEIHWFFKHYANPPTKKVMGARSTCSSSEGLNDILLPELFFYIDEITKLITRFGPVTQKFYLQLLALHDGPGLMECSREVLQKLANEEATIFTSIAQQLCDLSENPILRDTALGGWYNAFDFSGIRLDFLRLQACLSCGSSSINLADYRHLVEQIHSVTLHTKLVDFMKELLCFVSDMSVVIFYDVQFTELFNRCITCPAQLRFCTVFPSMCTQAVHAYHDLCPEERLSISQRSESLVQCFCQEICKQICTQLFNRIDEFGALADQLAPKNAARWLLNERITKKSKKHSNGTGSGLKRAKHLQAQMNASSKMMTNTASDSHPVPGYESFRTSREHQTSVDKTLFELSQLCYAVNHRFEFIIFDKVIDAREMLKNDIQTRIIEILTSYTTFVPVSPDRPTEVLIVKPSDLLRQVTALINVVTDFANFISLDVNDMLNIIFTQHAQPRDAFHGQPTMTARYCEWFISCLLGHACVDHFVYSPAMKSFITLVPPDTVHFCAEDYTNLTELIALTELISPLGMKYICERLIHSTGDQLDRMKKLVLQNRVTLETMRESFDDFMKIQQLGANLHHGDTVLNLLKEIGVTLALRKLCFEATNIVVERRVPFIMDSVRNLRACRAEHPNGHLLPVPNSVILERYANCKDEIERTHARLSDQLIVNDLCASFGIQSDLDSSLCVILHKQNMAFLKSTAQTNLNAANGIGDGISHQDLNYHIACLLMVFVAVVFPRLAREEKSRYHLDLEATENNMHCIALSFNAVMCSMFSLQRPNELEARCKEFLALASSNLLRLGLETSSSFLSSETSGATSQSANANMVQIGKHRDSLYVLFDCIIGQSPCLSSTVQESCFPYSLVRNACHNLAKGTGITAHPTAHPNTMSTSSHTDSKSGD